MTTKIYMQFGSIKGDVCEPKHKEWVELESCSYSSKRGIEHETGSSKRTIGHTSVSSIQITKLVNLSSQPIFNEAHGGNGTDVCTIHFVNDKGTFLEYKLHKAILCDYECSIVSNADLPPHETFNIHFTMINTRYIPQDTNSPRSAGFDMETGKLL